MKTRILPWAAAAASLVGGGPLAAQPPAPPPPPLEDDLYQRPEKPADFWNAARFERAAGKFDLAGRLLVGFLDAKPADKDYLDILDAEGTAALLRLRNVPRWSSDAKQDAAVKAAVETIITNATAAQRKQLSDPVRIGRLVANLSGDDEERAYAVRELARSGGAVVPVMLDALRDRGTDADRAAILQVLPDLPESTVPPLLAAVDLPDAPVRGLIVSALASRRDLASLTKNAETDPLPTLAYLAASPNQPESLRRQAGRVLEDLRATTGRKPQPAAWELTREAERFLDHKARFLDPQQATVWAVADGKLTPARTTVARAEEHLGLRYARWAMEIDPTYEPAQAAFLALAAERAAGRAGKPLAAADPAVYRLLAGSRAELLAAVLDRALRDKRPGLAEAVALALRDRAESRAGVKDLPERGVLVRALRYPDRRVQLAAAEALARVPGPPSHQASAAVVEVLRRALAADPDPNDPAAAKPRVLIGDPDTDRAQAIARVAREAGYDSVVAHTGRDVLRRLNEAADVDVVLIDHRIPYPDLPQLLAELRQDVHYGLLPVKVMTASGVPMGVPCKDLDWRVALRERVAPYDNVAVIAEPFTPGLLTRDFADAAEPGAVLPLTAEEKNRAAARAVGLLRLMATGDRAGYDVRPATVSLRQALRSTELAEPAADALGRIAGREVQADLAGLVVAGTRPPALRARAAVALTENLQRYGVALSAEEIDSLRAAADAPEQPDALRRTLAVLVGKFATDRAATAELLRGYAPPPAGDAPAAPAGGPKKKVAEE